MIASVSFEKTTWNRVPHKFEAGTPDIAGVIGLGAGLDYLDTLDREGRVAWEEELLRYATNSLSAFPGLKIHGTATPKASVISFTLGDVHPHDIGTILDQQGIAIRAGHHCTQPLMERLGVPATARASMAFYNTKEEIDALVAGLHKVREVFER
jgi:cysteine desulfurase/selenocysteine lyase